MSQRETADEATPRPECDEEGRPLFDEAGVDLTLIRWMLSLTPRERLEVLERNVAAALSPRERAAS